MEKTNGGYTVTIGSYSLKHIGEYSPSWVKVYDTQNSFTDYAGNEVKILKGLQFSLKLTTGRLTATDYNTLVTALKDEDITVSCPDFSGECICDDIPGNLVQANSVGTRYKVSFTLTAKEIIPSGSL